MRGYFVNRDAFAVCPAFNLSLSYIIFTSAVENGKRGEYTTVTFTEETKGTVQAASITKGFSLNTGGKIMI